MRHSLLSLASTIRPVVAQFPPSNSSFTTVLTSPIDPRITVSYKSPDAGTCTTVFKTQKQYSGYINVPPYTLAPIQQNYDINTFFWFFEAREEPENAPLTIWLNGGPGSSSMVGLFQENGPCEVVQLADGRYGTQPRLWGWDRASNMLYIDQPAQVGFSYDTLYNRSLDLIAGEYHNISDRVAGLPAWAYLNGTFSSMDSSKTSNTTEIAAYAVWHFLQSFLSAFPQYNPGVRQNVTTTNYTGVHLFTESYGGQYGPTFARVFEEQNEKRETGELSAATTLEIQLESLGIINGLVDELVQAPYWPKFANNNTYGIQMLDDTGLQNALVKFSGAGGCKEAISNCRTKAVALDADNDGDVDSVNTACAKAVDACAEIQDLVDSADRNPYDIRQELPVSFPSYAYLEYLNQGSVQKSIGARVNYTESNDAVYDAFSDTGDQVRGTQLSSLAGLLNKGIRVALIYGDADYLCNWQGGEAISLAVAALVPGYATHFPAAGYADVIPNATYIGGVVRQYGNLSFSRVYDAGHTVPASQPETAFTLFARIVQGAVEVGTGEPADLTTFASAGPANSSHTNETPDDQDEEAVCWIRAVDTTCTNAQRNAMLLGEGVVKFGVYYARAADYVAPTSTVRAGVPGSLPPTPQSSSSASSSSSSSSSSLSNGGGGAEGGSKKGSGDAAAAASRTSVPLTGVYVATSTPTPTDGAVAALGLGSVGGAMGLVLVAALVWGVGLLAWA